MKRHWFCAVTVATTLVVGGCSKGQQQAPGTRPGTLSQQVQAQAAEPAKQVDPPPVKAPEPPPVAKAPDDGGRPPYMPCRLVKNLSRGDLDNWWTFRYEAGRLVAARDERMERREFKLEMLGSVEKVDAALAGEPFGIHFAYDEAGRLLGYTEDASGSDKGKKITFAYDKSGRLASYADEYGQHKLTMTDKGVPATDRYSMGPMAVTTRYEYGPETPMLGKPWVWGRGEFTFGQKASYVTFPGKPEAQVHTIEYSGPQGGISTIRGHSGDTYTFVYDCSSPMKWH